MSSVIIYGDVSPNVIDGSSIWLVSVAEVLSRMFDTVHLQLKSSLRNDNLIQSVAHCNNVEIHQPPGDDYTIELKPEQAREAVEKLDKKVAPDAIIVRGINACNAFAWMLSDAAFGYVREYEHHNLDDIHVGDFVYSTNSAGDHVAIVLKVNEDSVTIAEGNAGKAVHWGREFPKKYITSIGTRY